MGGVPVIGRLLDPMKVGMAGGPMREGFLSELGPGTYGSQVMRLLHSNGLSLVDDVGEAEFRSRYAEPLGRRVALNEVERVALAVVRTA